MTSGEDETTRGGKTLRFGVSLAGEALRWLPCALSPRGSGRSGRRATVVIAEPSLTSVEGHYLEVALATASALDELGYDTCILAHEDASPHLTRGRGEPAVVPTFRRTGFETFQWSWRRGQRPRRYARLVRDALSVATDLTRGLQRAGVEAPARIFFQGSDLAQVLGATLLRPTFWRTTSTERQTHLFRFDPFGGRPDLPDDYDQPRLHERWARFLGPLVHSGRVRLLSDSEVVVDELRLRGLSARQAPIPVSPAPLPEPASGREIVVGFVGGVRLEKGGLLLPAIVERLLSTTACRFVLQVHPNLVNAELAAAIEWLRAIAGREPSRVALVEEPVSSERYRALLGEIDVLLLPYDPVVYRARTSGPCIEAMAAGKVIVGPARGWLGRQAVLTPAYRAVAEWSAESYAARAAEAVGDFEALRLQAREAALRVQSFHSPRGLALEISGSAHEVP